MSKSFVGACLNIYWSSDFKEEIIDSNTRMRAVLQYVRDEILPKELADKDVQGLFTEARALLTDAIEGTI